MNSEGQSKGKFSTGEAQNFVTHIISPDQVAITCGACGRTSHNPNDVANRYCDYCKKFHEP